MKDRLRMLRAMAAGSLTGLVVAACGGGGAGADGGPVGAAPVSMYQSFNDIAQYCGVQYRLPANKDQTITQDPYSFAQRYSRSTQFASVITAATGWNATAWASFADAGMTIPLGDYRADMATQDWVDLGTSIGDKGVSMHLDMPPGAIACVAPAAWLIPAGSFDTGIANPLGGTYVEQLRTLKWESRDLTPLPVDKLPAPPVDAFELVTNYRPVINTIYFGVSKKVLADSSAVRVCHLGIGDLQWACVTPTVTDKGTSWAFNSDGDGAGEYVLVSSESLPPPPATSGGGAANPTRADYALVTASPADTYAVGSVLDSMYARLNGVRLAASAGALTQNSALDGAAASHLAYLTQHWPVSGDTQFETQGLTGFTGYDPSTRAKVAGYSGAVHEAADFASSSSPSACLDDLFNTAYHQEQLLGGDRDVGIAYADMGHGVYGCVIELGLRTGAFRQLPDAGVVKHYTYDAQTGVPTSYAPSSETPNPAPDAGSKVLGQPIVVSMAAYDMGAPYTYSQFALKDSAGNQITTRLIAGPGLSNFPFADSHLGPGELVFIPVSPLKSGTTYTVDFAGASGTRLATATWTFTTR